MTKTRFEIEKMEKDFVERLINDKDNVYKVTDFIKTLALREYFERHNLVELENLTKHNSSSKKDCSYCENGTIAQDDCNYCSKCGREI